MKLAYPVTEMDATADKVQRVRQLTELIDKLEDAVMLGELELKAYDDAAQGMVVLARLVMGKPK